MPAQSPEECETLFGQFLALYEPQASHVRPDGGIRRGSGALRLVLDEFVAMQPEDQGDPEENRAIRRQRGGYTVVIQRPRLAWAPPNDRPWIRLTRHYALDKPSVEGKQS
jgi:hypothetical protein